jgi:hypothetical protein
VKKLALVVLIFVAASMLVLAQGRRVTITFSPEEKTPAFNAAVDEYRAIWAAEGSRIIEGMEKISTLKFPEKSVKVQIYEGTSFSGRGGAPMRLRASYQPDEKKGTLVHELGHRMNVQLKMRAQDLDEHRLLFLYLYDLYVDLYGKEFADREVAFGKTLKGLYDYEAAWNWAMAMSREERLAKFAEVVKVNRK